MIPTRAHGVLDYLSAAAMVAAPRLAGCRPELTRALDAVAAGTVAYSLLTDYELGLVPVLDMERHLLLDAAEGAGFCAAALLLAEETPATRAALAGFGLFALAVAALSDRRR